MRGAFTGAVRDRKGRIASASGGTLLLDEVGELPVAAQAKLCACSRRTSSVRSDQTCRRRERSRAVGDEPRSPPGDIARTLSRGPLLPTARARYRDALADSAPRRLAATRRALSAMRGAGRMSAEAHPRAWAALQAHSYPGNVRELKHIIQRAVILARGQDIRLEHLPDELMAESLRRRPSQRPRRGARHGDRAVRASNDCPGVPRCAWQPDERGSFVGNLAKEPVAEDARIQTDRRRRVVMSYSRRPWPG